MRQMLSHQEYVGNRLSSLTPDKGALFLCAVSQRQVPVYELFAADQRWGHVAGFRDLMQQCWAAALSPGTSTRPAHPNAEDFISSDFGQSGSSLAIEAYSSLEVLIGILNGEPISAAPVEYAYTILDSYLYGTLGLATVSAENDAAVDAHPLTVQEMQRQTRALDDISSTSWRAADWASWRDKAAQQSLLS
ncbi:MAG: DUF416 family protein [Pseudomonadota bacterium]